MLRPAVIVPETSPAAQIPPGDERGRDVALAGDEAVEV